MLQIKDIRKEYITGELHQKALDGVSLNLRDNEFVAVLGPSGSGKTTLLNIIGGLDRYDSGDLVINNISTKKYTDRDWDSYRNHTIGFIFQSYNLIPHQSVLSNVELALTISGISASERKERATHALEDVGLGDQIHKKPNQLSGGQMQRVAIARALVNDPDILLADEPTGALDTKTSVQIMDLLKEVAGDRLVVMVTHNPDLAETYATRIVRLQDGQIISDSDPYHPEQDMIAEHKNMGRSSMSFLTALGLSFNNLRTKKIRTLLTAFAGSIGIIGIALILSLSNGVNRYIADIQEETLSEYPLTISRSEIDFMSMMESSGTIPSEDDTEKKSAEVRESPTIGALFSGNKTNDLKSFKTFLDSKKSGIKKHANAVEYKYNITPHIFRLTDESHYRQINPDTSLSKAMSGASSDSYAGTFSSMGMMSMGSLFNMLPAQKSLYEKQYKVMAGHWPKDESECVLVLSGEGLVTDLCLYALGLKDPAELDAMIDRYVKGETVETSDKPATYKYKDFLGIELKLVNACDLYEYDSQYNLYVDKTDNEAFMLDKVKQGKTLSIAGVVRPKETDSISMLMPGIGYLPSLEQTIMVESAGSDIVNKQLDNPEINVFTGKKFGDEESAFDMASLITVDEDAMKNAFKFNPNVFSGLDLSSVAGSLSNFKVDASAMEAIDLAGIAKQINVDVSTDGINQMVSALVNAYMAQVSPIIDPENPPDMNTLLTGFVSFAMSGQGQAIMAAHAGNIVDLNELQQQVSAALSGTIAKNSEAVMQQFMAQALPAVSSAIGQQLSARMQNAFSFNASAFEKAIKINMDAKTLQDMMTSMAASGQASYDDNLRALGFAQEDTPSSVYIYPKDFEHKTAITKIIDKYNKRMEKAGEDDKVITYTDAVAALMGSVTDIIDTISYVLIAFVAISLVVSSIMIGIITYISVLERTKEIGILRAIGASKRNISQVFNAETFITGLLAGLIGVGISLLLLIPANAILLHRVFNHPDVTAYLQPVSGLILIILSVILTLIGGLIPSRSAAKKDPVLALRTE